MCRCYTSQPPNNKENLFDSLHAPTKAAREGDNMCNEAALLTGVQKPSNDIISTPFLARPPHHPHNRQLTALTTLPR